MNIVVGLAAFAIVSLAAVPPEAAAPAPIGAAVAGSPLSARQRSAVVDDVARLVTKNYVFSDRRGAIVERLRAARASRRYDTGDPAALAARLTEDLFAASSDRHMYVNYDPAAYAGIRASHGPADFAYAEAVGRRHNQGYEEQRILNGNVRYVRISQFYWAHDVTAHVIDDAARFLSGGDAAIVDLRGNGGGDGDAVHRLISYFLPSDGRLLMTYHDGVSDETTNAHVVDDLPAPRMTGKPLYVLVDRGTASAAEEFAYHVTQFKLGTLVGHTTAGAGNNNTIFPVAPGFMVSVSTGVVTHPVDKSNWEGKGVRPDVDVASAAALDQAHLLALRKLAAAASPEQRSAYEWDVTALRARLEPVALADDALAAYAGKYGIRTIRVENRALIFQRDGREPVMLRPLAPDLFGFSNNDAVRVRFRRSANRVTGFDQVTQDGQVIASDRTE